MDDRDTLLHAYLDGSIGDEGVERLEELLRSDPAARDVYLELADMHACMAIDETLWEIAEDPASERPALDRQPFRGRWMRSLSAACLGLLVGLCGSFVFAYVAPMAWKPVALLVEGFEQGVPPGCRGLATDDDAWSGDHSQIVDAERGVTPRDGMRMLRFLRADYEGKPPQIGYSGDLYRVIDVRTHRDLIESGNARVRVSMPFNAIEFPVGEHYTGGVGIYAFDGSFRLDVASSDPPALNELALAMARKGIGRYDRDPRTWQVAQNELRLPPDTEFVLVHLSVSHGTVPQRRDTFDGHYIDGVRVHLEFAQQEKRP